MTTLMQLRRLVRARLGVPVSDRLFTDDVLDDHINLAIEAVEAEQRWPWQEHVEQVTVDSMEPDIVTSNRWRATKAVFYETTELRLVSTSDLLQWAGNPAGSIPSIWAPIGNRIVLRPIPSGPVTVTHVFYTEPSWLRNDADEPEIPSEFTGAIVAKAAEMLATREDDRTNATGHLADYDAWIARMRRDVRRSTGPVRVRVRPGGWI